MPVKHYVAFCRSFFSDTWTAYDDSTTKIEYHSKKQILLQLSLLIYIEYTFSEGRKRIRTLLMW